MKIVHVLDSLARGGTETILLSLLPELAKRHEIVLVTLGDTNEFDRSQIVCARHYSLGYRGVRSIPRCVAKLRRIIKRESPDLVRAQLYFGGLVARLATPPEVPLVFSIHSTLSVDAYQRNRFALPLERLTYKRRHHMLSVSEHARSDFAEHVGLRGPSYVLRNFVRPEYLERSRIRPVPRAGIRMVAVGNLKAAKNPFLLVEAFKLLREVDISLDMYGDGPLRGALQQAINEHGLPIRLMGKRSDIPDLLPDYDLFVLASVHEGCPNAAMEAMATGLPVLASDIPAVREVTEGNGFFFNPGDPHGLAELVGAIASGALDPMPVARAALATARERYSLGAYVDRLESIYELVASSAGTR